MSRLATGASTGGGDARLGTDSRTAVASIGFVFLTQTAFLMAPAAFFGFDWQEKQGNGQQATGNRKRGNKATGNRQRATGNGQQEARQQGNG
jgi:hypothetical protein